jgi:hypothetical protein
MPRTILRYEFTSDQIVASMLGPLDYVDALITTAGDTVIIDVIEPTGVAAPEAPPETPSAAAEKPASEPSKGGPDIPPATKERKGGPRARRAGMLCQERAFQVWLEVEDKDAARDEVCRQCGVESRVDLDHNENAGNEWDAIERLYTLWLDGYEEPSPRNHAIEDHHERQRLSVSCVGVLPPGHARRSALYRRRRACSAVRRPSWLDGGASFRLAALGRGSHRHDGPRTACDACGDARGRGGRVMPKALALPARQVTALCKGAAKAGFIPEVKIGDVVIRLIPEENAQPKGRIDQEEDIRL